MITEISELTPALRKTNGEVEVSELMYWHFLEVLPPREMGLNYFVFQEGSGERLIFRSFAGKFTCALLGDYLVTKDGKYHMMIARTFSTDEFVIKGIFSDRVGEDLPAELVPFAGQSFPSPLAIEEATRLCFRI